MINPDNLPEVVRVVTPDGISHCYSVEHGTALCELNGHATAMYLNYVTPLQQWYLIDTNARSLTPVQVRQVWDIPGHANGASSERAYEPGPMRDKYTVLVVTTRYVITANNIIERGDGTFVIDPDLPRFMYDKPTKAWTSHGSGECTVTLADLATHAQR